MVFKLKIEKELGFLALSFWLYFFTRSFLGKHTYISVWRQLFSFLMIYTYILFGCEGSLFFVQVRDKTSGQAWQGKLLTRENIWNIVTTLWRPCSNEWALAQGINVQQPPSKWWTVMSLETRGPTWVCWCHSTRPASLMGSQSFPFRSESIGRCGPSWICTFESLDRPPANPDFLWQFTRSISRTLHLSIKQYKDHIGPPGLRLNFRRNLPQHKLGNSWCQRPEIRTWPMQP